MFNDYFSGINTKNKASSTLDKKILEAAKRNLDCSKSKIDDKNVESTSEKDVGESSGGNIIQQEAEAE